MYFSHTDNIVITAPRRRTRERQPVPEELLAARGILLGLMIVAVFWAAVAAVAVLVLV